MSRAMGRNVRICGRAKHTEVALQDYGDCVGSTVDSGACYVWM